jgi:hypothetical protein
VLWGSSISWVASESIFVVSAYALGYCLYRVCSLVCLPVSRLFWVSSLAYPNLLGTKGYVVVVVRVCSLDVNEATTTND